MSSRGSYRRRPMSDAVLEMPVDQRRPESLPPKQLTGADEIDGQLSRAERRAEAQRVEHAHCVVLREFERIVFEE